MERIDLLGITLPDDVPLFISLLGSVVWCVFFEKR
jgi:hypothetical protein